jgi:AbrB family looped-hinge helix DNA binding protein
MNLKIDKEGRVLLPKPVRDRLGLRAGSELEIRETPEGVLLRLSDRKPSLVKKGSFLVHTGEIPKGFDVTKAIDEDRKERARKAWGPVNQ